MRNCCQLGAHTLHAPLQLDELIKPARYLALNLLVVISLSVSMFELTLKMLAPIGWLNDEALDEEGTCR